MKPHRKIKHNEKLSRTRVRSLRPRSRPQSDHRTNCASNPVSAITYNLPKLHRKIKHKKCAALKKQLPAVQGQGHNQVSAVKSSLCDNLKSTEVNFINLHNKRNNNQKVCRTQYLFPKVRVNVIIWWLGVKLRLCN